jgi:hypothetical protein
MVELMREAIDRCQLDLARMTVLTEAATGAYVVTPILAALAGARVHAIAGSTRYGSADELQRVTADLARLAGVTELVSLAPEKTEEIVRAADIVTNCGQVRPIDKQMIAAMKDSAVVPLMYESWEYRAADLDLDACRVRGIAVAGTNERHPAVDVFSFLGPLAVRQLHDAGISAYRSRVILLCDNDFAPFMESGLRDGGAEVIQARSLSPDLLSRRCDAVIVALQPRAEPVLTEAAAQLLATLAPGAVVVEYWGDTDRAALAAASVPVWPPRPAPPGHMAILLSALGPEPIIRLQAGGLKVGEVLARGVSLAPAEDRAFVQLM